MPSIQTTFEPNVISTNGPYVGYYWSNPANWSNGVPVNGGQVIDSATNSAGANSIDDLASLSLDSLTLLNPSAVAAGEPFVIVAGSLTVGTVLGTNFNTIWVESGAGAISSIVNIGTLSDPQGDFAAIGAGNTFEVSSQLTSSSFIQASGGTVLINAIPPNNSSFSLGGAPSTIAFSNLGTASGITLDGLAAGDRIELPGTSVSSVSVTGSSFLANIDIVTNVSDYLLRLFAPQITVAPNVSYTAAVDPSTGLEAVTFALCFAEGSYISTPDGHVAIEELRIGDHVLTGSGKRRPIRWIGRRRVDLTKHPESSRIQPVRVARDAFGPGRPWSDLVLSPDHALFIDDALIPVRLLMNGTSIAAFPCDRVTYYHVELPSHDVLLANGLLAESYLETGGRSAFDNGGCVVQAHPDFASRSWDAAGCAPLVVAGPVLVAVRARLSELCDVISLQKTRRRNAA